MTITQQIHNLFFGENLRELNREYHYQEMSVPSYLDLLASPFMVPDPSKVWGVDISPWDGNVDLAVTRQKGARFVFIKGMDGTVRSRYFPENRARAVAAGLLQAPYHWLYRNANVSAAAQASALDALIKQYPADLPAMVDFEWTRYMGVASDPSFNDLDLMVTAFLNLGNRKPILYSAAGFMNGLGRMPDALKAKFSGICIANYGVSWPLMPIGYAADSWTFWQWTDYGDAQTLTPSDSNKKELDLDYWKGDVQSLYSFAGVTPPDGEPMANTFYRATGNISMRTGPGTSYPIAQLNGVNQYVNNGDIVEVDRGESGMAHIVKIYRNNVSIEIPPVAWAGTLYLQLTTYIPPTVPAETVLPDLPMTIVAGDDINYEKQTVNIVLKAKR